MRCGAELRDGSTHSRSAGRAPARPLRTDRTNRGAGRGGRNGDRGRVPPLLAETRRCCARRVTAEGSLRAAAAVELPWHRRGFPELGRSEAPGQGKRSLVVPAAWSRARRGWGLWGGSAPRVGTERNAALRAPGGRCGREGGRVGPPRGGDTEKGWCGERPGVGSSRGDPPGEAIPTMGSIAVVLPSPTPPLPRKISL